MFRDLSTVDPTETWPVRDPGSHQKLFLLKHRSEHSHNSAIFSVHVAFLPVILYFLIE